MISRLKLINYYLEKKTQEIHICEMRKALRMMERKRINILWGKHRKKERKCCTRCELSSLDELTELWRPFIRFRMDWCVQHHRDQSWIWSVSQSVHPHLQQMKYATGRSNGFQYMKDPYIYYGCVVRILNTYSISIFEFFILLFLSSYSMHSLLLHAKW